MKFVKKQCLNNRLEVILQSTSREVWSGLHHGQDTAYCSVLEVSGSFDKNKIGGKKGPGIWNFPIPTTYIKAALKMVVGHFSKKSYNHKLKRRKISNFSKGLTY